MTIAVYGAGGIGCYVGGRLLASGTDVVLVGRQRVADQLAEHGLRLTDYRDADLRGHFHQGTEGGLDIQRHPGPAAYSDAFARAGLPLKQHEDMPAVQWSKLLLNLNNAVNALSDLPLRDELSQRDYRRCLAAAQAEALELLAAKRITPARLIALPSHRLPAVLRLPDFLFRRLASKMLAIDPVARSSMWEDLQAGRRTEVDYLNGEVVRLAESLGRQAPINARLVELIRAAETGAGHPWTGADLLRELTRPTT